MTTLHPLPMHYPGLANPGNPSRVKRLHKAARWPFYAPLEKPGAEDIQVHAKRIIATTARHFLRAGQ